MQYNRAQLKQGVKLSMRGSAPNPMLVTLLFIVVVSLGTGLINGILGGMLTGGVDSLPDSVLFNIQRGYEVEEAVYAALLELFRRGPGALFGAVVGGIVLSILVSLWRSSMDTGYAGYCLSMVRGENPPVSRIFCALPQFGQVLVTRFFTGLFELLWSLLVAAGYAVILVVAILIDVPALTVPLVLADVVLLIVGVIWVTMRYALVDFALIDKGLYGMDAVRESKRLMRGRIKDGFVLQLSFFGWYLLEVVIVYAGVILSVVPVIAASGSLNGLMAASGFAVVVMVAAAIGTVALNLWLKPYVTGSMARFYDWADGGGFGGYPGGPGFPGGSDGWSEHRDYTWGSGPSSGTGVGSGPRDDAPPPRKPRDDPWS